MGVIILIITVASWGDSTLKAGNTGRGVSAQRKPGGVQKADFPADATAGTEARARGPGGRLRSGTHWPGSRLEGKPSRGRFSCSLRPGAGAAGSRGDKGVRVVRSLEPSELRPRRGHARGAGRGVRGRPALALPAPPQDPPAAARLRPPPSQVLRRAGVRPGREAGGAAPGPGPGPGSGPGSSSGAALTL